MRVPNSLLALSLTTLAAAALAGEPLVEGAPPAKEDQPARAAQVVVIQDRVPVRFQDSQIGELVEGQRLTVLETRQDWYRVRAAFGQSWFEGWVRSAFTVVDSMQDVPLKIAPTRPVDVYRDPVDSRRDHIIPGQQFLEVRVKFEPTEKSPPRLYFSWSDERNADICVRYGREGAALPYGFVRQIPGMTRATFERDEKRQILLLKPDEPLIETYVFAVPVRAREFDLILKDVTTRVPIRR